MENSSLQLIELDSWCENLVKSFSDRQLVLLDGPLGAGKTELVKRILHSLGIKEVSSPTYSLIHQYRQPKSEVFVAHIDLYRIKGEEDLESTGFWDLFSEPKGLILIEWANKIKKEDLPLQWTSLQIDIQKNDEDVKRTYITTYS